MTIVFARDESDKWKRKIEAGELVALEGVASEDARPLVKRVS